MTQRQIVAKALNATGITALLERWANRIRPSCASILMYHRVGPPSLSAPLYQDMVGPSAELFEAQIEFLSTHCRILDLDEYLDYRERGKPLPPRSVILTVDDGYADCFTTVYPILRRHGAPATVFLPTGYLDSPSLFWWDKLAYMVSCCPHPELVLEQPHAIRIDLREAGFRESAARALVKQAKALPHNALENFLHYVAEKTDAQPDESLASRNYLLTWDQVRAMAADGIAFGSHTVTHPILSFVDLERARWEIQHSRRRLEEELGRPVNTFCYPSGEAWSFGPVHRELLSAEGFRCAVTSVDGFNEPGTDVFSLRRIWIGAADDPPTLRAGLTGALRWLTKIKKTAKQASRRILSEA